MSENLENKTSDGKFFRKVIESGTELVAGTLLEVLSGSPEAVLFAAGSAVTSIVLKDLVKEFSRRHLGPREEARIGGVLILASKEIHKRSERGDSFREDGFFDEKVTGRKDAEEVIENVLLKCQRDPEEKKIKYMANLLSNICFDSKISADTAHRIIKVAEQLTYRQLCILKICAIKDSLGLRGDDYRGQGRFSKNLYPILYECYDLSLSGYINLGGEVAFGPTDIKPSQMNIQGLGGDIFNLMGLGGIPEEDLHHLISHLK